MREPPKEIHAFYAGSELVDEFYAKDFHILATDGVPWPYTTKYIRRDAITPAIAAQVLLGDDINISKMAKAMHDGPLGAGDHWFSASTEAGGWCVEMARTALKAIAQEEGK